MTFPNPRTINDSTQYQLLLLLGGNTTSSGQSLKYPIMELTFFKGFPLVFAYRYHLYYE
jgi:hypothetical protein